MSNIKAVRIIADVPFNYLDEGSLGGGLPDSEIAAIGSLLLSPSIGLTYSYSTLPGKPNARRGVTSMYRLTIEGEEAISVPYLRRVCTSLAKCGEFAQLHVAEYRDLEFTDHEPWSHIVPSDLLSGEATR
jgi:hypothetical protein